MSSATMTPVKENLFYAYLVNQNEDNNTGDSDGSDEKPTEKTEEPSASWLHEAYSPQRVSFHTVQGRIKRFFA